MSEKQAWYLGCRAEQIADRVILLGDPARVARFARYLSNIEHIPVNRGLSTVTGDHDGRRVTLAAFGMGAPIATIVLHELVNLGARAFLRIGTAIGLAPVQMGELAIANEALAYDGTSSAYAISDRPPQADATLVDAVTIAAKAQSAKFHTGRFASFDAFYRDMFALDPAIEARVAENFDNLRQHNVLAVDMETAALLTAGQALGCQVTSLCASTVDDVTKEKLSAERHDAVEVALITIALNALSAID